MYIEEVIIDGFKSYAHRTVISGWDPQLNAITGLNGSGKSNILDALCFIMGIDNLKQIRANTLQDLIYKRGATGVNSASVTVIFNNEASNGSPIGFTSCPKIAITRQVILGGKNKFLINGTSVTQDKVNSLFRSAHLNVNNPHFLIMQGQVTKILNMKPQEISIMLEETAGTRLYQEHKEKAIQTLEKKDSKLKEISELLISFIVPKLNSLRLERSSSLEQQALISELEKNEYQLSIYNYYQLISEKTHVENLIQSYTDSVIEFEESQQALESERKLFLTTMESNASSLALLNGQIEDIVKEITSLNSELVTMKAKKEAIDEIILSLDVTLQDFNPDSQDTERSSDKKVDRNSLQNLCNEYNEISEDLLRKEKQLSDLSTRSSVHTSLSDLANKIKGLNRIVFILDSTSSMTSFQDELAIHEEEISSLTSSINHRNDSEKSLWHSTTLKFQEELLHKNASINTIANELEELGNTLKGFPDGNQLLKMKSEKESMLFSIKNSINHLKERLAQFIRLPNLKNVASDNVHGSVASLIHLSDTNRQWALALETCAGGRLYNLVVDSETDASKILQTPSNRSRRITILPLSKIQGRTLPKSILQKVSLKVANFPNSMAVPASSLIELRDTRFSPIIDFIFGTIFVTDSKELAQSLAFDKSINVKCVTKEGDVYDPSGTMTGGARSSNSNNESSVLGAFSELSDLCDKLKSEENLLETNVNIHLQKRFGVLDLIEKKTSLITLENNTLAALMEQMAKHPYSLALKKLEEDILKLESCQTKKIALMAKIEQFQNRISKLVKEHQSLTLETSQELKIDNLKKEISSLRPQKVSLQSEISHLKSLIIQEELNAKILEEKRLLNEKSKSDLQHRLQESKSQLDFVVEKISSLEDSVIASNNSLLKLNMEFTLFEGNAKKLREKMSQIDSQRSHNMSLIKKITSDIAASNASVKSLSTLIKELMKENPNLTSMQPNSLPKAELMGHINSLKTKILDLKEKIGKKSASLAMQSTKNKDSSLLQMIDSLERQEAQLEKNLTRVKQDKQKIESAMAKLNKFREEALKETFYRVNKDFGEIFEILLPQNFAELVINSESFNISEGVNIRVRLGSVWKNSLSELSGGQKSLVALALILAMLQFSPAPIYILDEIDAALDLSHTQHIGSLLKTKFSGAQFIIVSLKEGLFNHSDVLFRTKFVDGISVVERHQNPKKQKKSKNRTEISLNRAD